MPSFPRRLPVPVSGAMFTRVFAALTLGIVAGIVLAGNYLTRPIFTFIHAARLPELRCW